MRERILEFLQRENKSSAQLAEEIGVQASGISHILSGRNNPSLDFILKMLGKYQFISTDWLLFGRGSMYTETKMQSLFDYDNVVTRETGQMQSKTESVNSIVDYQDVTKDKNNKESTSPLTGSNSDVVKIVWFYENNSFEEFFPRK